MQRPTAATSWREYRRDVRAVRTYQQQHQQQWRHAKAHPVATHIQVHQLMKELLQLSKFQAHGIPIAKIKQIFLSHFGIRLCEAALGHRRLLHLLEHLQNSSACTLQRLPDGQLNIMPASPGAAKHVSAVAEPRARAHTQQADAGCGRSKEEKLLLSTEAPHGDVAFDEDLICKSWSLPQNNTFLDVASKKERMPFAEAPRGKVAFDEGPLCKAWHLGEKNTFIEVTDKENADEPAGAKARLRGRSCPPALRGGYLLPR